MVHEPGLPLLLNPHCPHHTLTPWPSIFSFCFHYIFGFGHAGLVLQQTTGPLVGPNSPNSFHYSFNFFFKSRAIFPRLGDHNLLLSLTIALFINNLRSKLTYIHNKLYDIFIYFTSLNSCFHFKSNKIISSTFN